MNGKLLLVLDGSTLVNGLTSDVHDATEGTVTDGNHDGVASVGSLAATDETLGTLHGNSTNSVLTKVLGNLEDETTATKDILNLESVQDSRKLLSVELDVDDGTNDGLDGAGLALRGSLGGESAGWKG